MKRRVFVILALLAMGLMLVSPAAAESPEPDPHTLVGDGDGLAMLFGKGNIKLSGHGILWVKAEEGARVEVTGYGEKEVFPDGWQQYVGFHGTAHIVGRRLRVIVAGVDIHLKATGRGRVLLWGHGTHQQADTSGFWSTSGLGTSIALSEPTSR
ncbi:MAG: hypothetical protein JSV81_05960 [Anaerolineales bacterium]|nr:MAG: hypothetical protein JSV81_05960 [Anaerolineales bacterium]